MIVVARVSATVCDAVAKKTAPVCFNRVAVAEDDPTMVLPKVFDVDNDALMPAPTQPPPPKSDEKSGENGSVVPFPNADEKSGENGLAVPIPMAAVTTLPTR